MQPVEIVERRNLGHPDTICDGIAEHICVRRCRYYLDPSGVILHHNVDKISVPGWKGWPLSGRSAIATGSTCAGSRRSVPGVY